MTRIKCANVVQFTNGSVNDLSYVTSYSLDKGHLYLSLRANGGILEFAPQAAQ